LKDEGQTTIIFFACTSAGPLRPPPRPPPPPPTKKIETGRVVEGWAGVDLRKLPCHVSAKKNCSCLVWMKFQSITELSSYLGSWKVSQEYNHDIKIKVFQTLELCSKNPMFLKISFYF